MEEDKNLEQNLDKSNEKSHISDVYNDSLKLEEINYQNGGKSFDILWEKGDKETIKELLFFYGDVSAISHLIQYQRKNYR